jgi:hypothetical protein
MFNKTFRPFLTAILASAVFVPAVLAAKPIQELVAPAWIMKFEQAANASFDRDKLEIKKVIENNISSVNAGDGNGYLRTLAPTSVEYKKAIQNPGSIKLLKGFGLIFNVQQIDYIKVSGNEAEVQIKLLTSIGKTGLLVELEKLKKESGTRVAKDGSVTTTSIKTSGDLTKSQVSTGTLKLGKVNGKWLITAMTSSKSSSLNSSVASRVSPVSIASQLIKPADRQVFQQVFTRHLRALNQEKLGDYLATLDPNSPNYIAAKASTLKLFQNYDLKYDLKTTEVISMGKQDAIVKLTATVKKIKGGDFTDSQMVTINTVRKTNGQWRIYDTQIENISALNTVQTNVAKR